MRCGIGLNEDLDIQVQDAEAKSRGDDDGNPRPDVRADGALERALDMQRDDRRREEADRTKGGNMKRGGQKYAFVWYRPEAWSQLKATAADANDLEDTYDQWHANAESTFKALRRQGMWLEKVEIDIDALLAWCEAQGQAPDATARSTYAAHLLQGRDQGQDLTPARAQAKEKNRPGGRTKELSPKAHDIAVAAEQLYREQKLPVDEITQLLKISKSTLYRYLRHQGVAIAGKRR